VPRIPSNRGTLKQIRYPTGLAGEAQSLPLDLDQDVFRQQTVNLASELVIARLANALDGEATANGLGKDVLLREYKVRIVVEAEDAAHVESPG
jgi:hypothetical protein